MKAKDLNQGMVIESSNNEKGKEFKRNHNIKNVKNTSQFLNQVLGNSDILIEVLDARDPMGCRCRSLEI